MTFWSQIDARERIALLVSGAMVLTTLGYWVIQIEGVRAMLKLAYPG